MKSAILSSEYGRNFYLLQLLPFEMISSIFSGYVLDDFPSLSEASMSVKDQLELIRNWKMRPDFIINLKVRIWL